MCERMSSACDRWFDRCQRKGSSEQCMQSARCACSEQLTACKEKLNASCLTQFSAEISGSPDSLLSGGCNMTAAPRLVGLTSLTFAAFLLDYCESHQWGIGTTESYRQLAEEHCQCDLTALFEELVYER